MSADLATLAIVVESDQATQHLNTFSRASEHAVGSVAALEHGAEKLEHGLAKLRTALGLGLFGFEFVQSTIKAQNSMAQLEAGVRSTGAAAGFTAEQLRKQAFEFEELSNFTHVAIEETQSILLLFQRLGGTRFEEATQSAIDLATRLGTDVPSAARQLGKALEDPINGLTALRRAGIVFSQGQKEMLNQMILSGHEAEAQATILDTLKAKLQGSAAAARDTLGGALKAVSHEFENLFEISRGGSGVLVNSLNAIAHGLRTVREHTDALVFSAQVLVGSYAGKMLTALSAHNAAIRQQILGTQLAIEAQARHTATMTANAIAAESASRWELKLAEQHLFNAKANEQCAFAEEERIATLNALAAAEIRLAEAEAAVTTATIRVTEAHIAEGIAVTALARTTVVGAGLLAQAGAVAQKAWTLIGGPIGAAIISALAINALLDQYLDKQSAVAEQTEAQSRASDHALAKAHERNAELKRRAEAEDEARIAAAKANAERDADTAKLGTLNRAYRQSTLELKLMEIALSGVTEKVKAHKDVKQSEWAAINRSIDAQIREQQIAVRHADQLEREGRLRGTQRGNVGAVRVAAQELELSQLTSAEVERRKVALALENALYAARLDFAEKTVRASAAQVETAQQEYESDVRRAKSLRDIALAQVVVNEQLAHEAEQLQLNAQYAAEKDAAFARGLAMMQAIAQQAEETKSRAVGLVTEFFHAAAGGATGFWESFRLSAERAFAELATKKLVTRLMQNPDILAMFGGGAIVTGPNEASEAVMSPEMIAKLHPMSRLGMGIKAAGQGLAIAGTAFTVGNLFGGQTTNAAGGAALGALGGAGTGAAIGAMGGPIGVVAGAIIGAGAGLVGGFLGAKSAAEKAAAALKAMEKAQLEVSASLASWRAEITGTAADQKAAAILELRLKYLNILADIERLEAGKKMEKQRERDLAEAAELYQMAQDKLKNSTDALNSSFEGLVGAVNGYKLNLRLFQFSPSLGPPSSPSIPVAPQNGGSSGQPSGDGGTAPLQTIVVQLVLDGKIVAKSTVRALQGLSQAQFGTPDEWGSVIL